MPTLGKYLIQNGFQSSKNVRQLLSLRCVTVNNIIETSFSYQITSDFNIKVNGILVTNKNNKQQQEQQEEEKEEDNLPYIIIYYKPCGVISSVSDESNRNDLSSILTNFNDLYKQNLHPIGRLDYHSCGLLLFTNNGRLTRYLLDPSMEIPRKYECVVTGIVNHEILSQQLQNGVINRFGEPYYATLLYSRELLSNEIYEHQSCKDGNLRYDGPIENSLSWLENYNTIIQNLSIVVVEVHEGKQRMVRRMLAHCGHNVLNLKRLAYGNIELGLLNSGECRKCTLDERIWANNILLLKNKSKNNSKNDINCSNIENKIEEII